MKIDGEGFMQIFAEAWPRWSPAETIRKASKRIGISSNGLNVDDMQQEKFTRAESILSLTSTTPSSSSSLPIILSPKSERHGFAAYWKAKF